MALLVYVDNITLAGALIEIINDLKTYLNSAFKLKDLGEPLLFLET